MRHTAKLVSVLLIGLLVLLSVGRHDVVTAGDNVWTTNGPKGGVIWALAIDPETPTTLYAGTFGGVFKSRDGGGSWSAASTGLPDTGVWSLAIDPETPATLYAGSIGGVFKSTDGGGNWSPSNTGLTSTSVEALVIDPQTPATLYSGTFNHGVFKSTDGGGNWSPVNAGLTNLEIHAVRIDPATPTTLYAGTFGGGVFKSTNGGDSWSQVNTGLTDLFVQTLAIDPATPTTLYAGLYQYGVFKSEDGGGTWNHANTGIGFGSVLSLAIDSATPTTLYAGTKSKGVCKSTNGGDSWSEVSTGLTDPTVDALAIDPGALSTLYAGTGGGVFRSTDGGGEWSAANTGLIATRVLSLAIDPATPTTIYAGTYGGAFKSTDAGGSWGTVNTGLAYPLIPMVQVLAINPATPTTLYAGTNENLFKSTNGGGSWSEIYIGLTHLYVRALAIDPDTPSILYAGTYLDGVFKSTNAGGNWSEANTGLTSLNVFALAIDPETPTTLYAGTGYGGVFKSTDGGGNWSEANTGLTSLRVFALAIDPETPATLYAGTRNGGVFKTTSAGGSWSPASIGLTSLEVYALAIHPDTPATLYAGTHGGVFKSTNGGGSWSELSTGLTTLHIEALAIDPQTPSIIYAGTYGGGAFDLQQTGLQVSHVELTQAIQDGSNSVPLIADKPTFVRVYLNCGTECTGEPLTGLLQGYGPSGELPGSPVLPINDSVVPRSELWTSQRDDLDKTLNYTLPAAWASGEITLVAEVEGTSFSQPVTFLLAKDVPVGYVPVRYEGQEPTDRIDTAFIWAERNWPTANVDYQPIPTMTWSPPVWCNLGKLPYLDYKNCFVHYLVSELTKAGRKAGVKGYLFGWLPESTSICDEGICLLGGAATTSQGRKAAFALDAEGEEGHLRFAHEAGHLLGRGHTVAPGDPLGGCANPDPTGSDWPYFDTATIEQWGLDGSGFDWLFQSASALKSPDDTYDYMSYCWSTDYAAQPAWTSAWNYTHMYSETLRLDGLEAVTTPPSEPEPYLILSGFVFTDSTAILDPMWVVSSTLQPESPPVGSEYCLEAEDDTGVVLSNHCFDLQFTDHQTGEPTGLDGFNLTVPYPNGVARIVLKMGSEELAERLVSAHAPEVTVLSPNGGESWPVTGTASISWSSSDADGDPLTCSVSYSPDGTDWVPVGGTITETQVTVDAGELAGGSGARVRVMVTDGINTSTDESDAAFEVGRKAPTAYILSPDASANVGLGTPVPLSGYAYDLEDGVLADSALQWTSSLDGDLGTGSQLRVTLSQGKHVVTFTATDSDGSNGSAQVLISVVVHRIYLPVVTKAH
jgi:photosystem II stability/assembly factor-like uncharacterized protein